jgi:hypothetical protein
MFLAVLRKCYGLFVMTPLTTLPPQFWLNTNAMLKRWLSHGNSMVKPW